MTKLGIANMRNISRILPKRTMVKQMRSDGGMDPILDVIYGRPKQLVVERVTYVIY